MKVYWGSYPFPANATHWLVSERPMLQNGQRYAKKLQVACMGDLLGDTNSLAAQIGAMRNACALIGLDLQLRDNGGTVKELMSSVGALVPTQTIAGPDFTSTHPGEYATKRHFSVVFEGTFKAGNQGLIVLELLSSIQIDGGGPSVVWRPSSNGPRQRQSPEPRLPQTLTQSGQATTRNLPYFPPVPDIRPSALVPNLSSVRQDQRNTETGVEFVCSWKYVYQDTTPF